MYGREKEQRKHVSTIRQGRAPIKEKNVQMCPFPSFLLFESFSNYTGRSFTSMVMFVWLRKRTGFWLHVCFLKKRNLKFENFKNFGRRRKTNSAAFVNCHLSSTWCFFFSKQKMKILRGLFIYLRFATETKVSKLYWFLPSLAWKCRPRLVI